MAATGNKQAQLAAAQAALKKKYPATAADPAARPVLEEVVYGIVREGATPPQADAAWARLKAEFFDWNEVRVSTIQEIADAFADLPHAGPKAKRVVEFLQEHFERTYTYSMDDLTKKGLKDAAKQIARYKNHGVSDFVVAWVTQRALGGHAVPLDEPALRPLRRLAVVEPEADDLEAIRASVEHFVPKANGPAFTDQLALFAAEVCQEKPLCPTCPLRADCPHGQAVLAKTKPAEPKSKPKGK